MANSTLRWHGLHVEFLLRQGVLYSLMTAILAGGYVLLISGFSLAFSSVLVVSNPYIIGATVFLLAIASFPLHAGLREMVDGIFLRQKKPYQDWLFEFGREISQVVDDKDALALLRKHVVRALSPSIMHVFLYVESTGSYTATEDESGKPSSDLSFSADSALISILSSTLAPISWKNSEFYEKLTAERARLKLLNTQLLVPLICHRKPIGFLALSTSTTGKSYTAADIAYLEALCNQTSLALDRMRTVAVLEGRVEELDTIARIAAGINATPAFDDMLEMVYAQTNKVVPISDFQIVLRDERARVFRDVFCIVNGERLRVEDHGVLGSERQLALDVIRTGKPILAGDPPGGWALPLSTLLPNGVYAWMGTPLNAGAETIGALCLASRDPDVSYTLNHVSLMQAVAGLLAGAIVKMRLFEESERRARQLASLNEVARSLTSTLEIDPLLENMLRHAIEMLDCEAGSLLLVDEETGELVFTLALGPVGGDLVGRRLPPGAGLAGKAIRTRSPVVQNDVSRSEDWFDTDRQTGYVTKNVLAVPLEANEQILGVLEVLNKRNGAPFDRDDQELLRAYAGQAAIALENARLYTHTDQALAAKVEELSAMYRIDRELNASLDLEHVMRITLDWSIDRSQADAGLIGLVEDGHLLVMACRGYNREEIVDSCSYLKGELPFVSEAIEHGYFQRVEFKQPSEKSNKLAKGKRPSRSGHGRISKSDRGRLLPGAIAQMAVPVKRQDQVLGVIVLEKIRGGFPEETCSFMNRLGDHAAIAISNAQLYAAVESANLAKSQFVSAAAHELKNPLTSIKGYSDLLAGGAVGAVNEHQARFLATIRSNADRMSTLVSDLQDISRIEAGQMQLQFSTVSIEEAAGEAIHTLRKQIEEKHQSLSLQFSPDLPKAWADTTRLIQILTNLLSNACKYTPPGGEIVLAAEVSRERKSPQRNRQAIHLSVSDTGIGISPEEQKRIFQQFFRSEDPRVREITGTGLGLSITRRLVEMQGGQIWFESVPDKGTTFHFTIPAAEID